MRTALGVEGIGVADGREMLIADTPAAFAAAVLRLLEDARSGGTLRRHLGTQGRRFVEATYSWDHIIPQLNAVLARAGQP